ncbi:MAG: polyprenyl synthetase family protein [Kiritimatiellae bacterium]|nr:polyprenyl synthetase family protein [Kiritimatiellia bacterium]
MSGNLAELAEKAVAEALGRMPGRPGSMEAAIRHAVGGPGHGGKRIRPQICLASAVAAGGEAADAMHAAAAIELLHNYTLVHDDLPAMDNDTMRRGAPSTWARFGEAGAILAGDALQALAFREASLSAKNAAAVVAELAEAAYGVVAGQVEDVERSGDFDYIYRHKTADLFIAAARMGAASAGAAESTVDALGRYARELGLAFQHRDDILDGDSPFGEETARRLVSEKTAAAIAALDGLPGDVAFLAELAASLERRNA